MTVAYHKFNCFVEDQNKGLHAIGTHVYKVALTNTLPVATQTVYDTVTNHPAPAAANGYPSGGATVTPITNSQTGGTYTLGADKVNFLATAGGIGPFQYAVLYNTNGTKPLVAWWDYGSSITLAAGESIDVKFNDDATDGTIFTET